MKQILAGGHVIRTAWWTPDGIVVGKCLESTCLNLVPPRGNMWCAAHRTLKLRERSRRWAAERPSRAVTQRRRIPKLVSTDVDIVAVELACDGRRVVLNMTERRTAVAVLTGRGYSAAQIAERLRILERTVQRDRAINQENAS